MQRRPPRRRRNPCTNITASSVEAADFKMPGGLDVVWTSENYHDLHNAMFGKPDMKVLDKAIFDALKPGGVFLVEDHVAASGSGARDTDTLHRIDPELVKQEVTSVGFKFEGGSDVLHNPDDTHDAKVFGPAGPQRQVSVQIPQAEALTARKRTDSQRAARRRIRRASGREDGVPVGGRSALADDPESPHRRCVGRRDDRLGWLLRASGIARQWLRRTHGHRCRSGPRSLRRLRLDRNWRSHRQHLYRHVQSPQLADLQYADAHDLARQLLATIILDVEHHAVLARLAGLGVRDGAVDTQCAVAFTGVQHLSSSAEAQMVPASRAHSCALEHGRLAMRANPRRTRRT